MVPLDAIYKGATRPPMKFGVPLVPLVLVLALAALVTLWVGTLVTWWVLPAMLAGTLPLLFWMRHVTHHDDQRLRQFFIAARLRIRDRNRTFWRARSYCAYLHRGTSDGTR